MHEKVSVKRVLAAVFFSCAFCTAVFARRVEGSVHYGSWMISGAIVTDGNCFARTSADGSFRLDIGAESRYIQVVTPAGFAPLYQGDFPAYWQETEGRVWFDFEFFPTSASSDFTLFAIPDQSVTDPDGFDVFEGEYIPNLTDKVISARIKGLTAGVLIGSGTSSLYRNKVRKLLTGLKIPLYGGQLSDGPSNTAFFIGKYAVVCTLDAGPEATGFVRGLLSMLPDGTDVIIATSTGKEIKIEDHVARGRQIYFVAPNFGAPSGYKIYSCSSGRLEWHYHGIELGEDCQVSVLPPGRSRRHPNEIVANILDYDDMWSVSWSEDGVAKGLMSCREPNTLCAAPGRYAKAAKVEVWSRFGKTWTFDVNLASVDIQRHLTFRDKTIQSFENEASEAASSGVGSIEFGLQLTTGGRVVAIKDSYPKFTEQSGVEVGPLIDKLDSLAKRDNLSPMRFTFAINSGSGAGEGKVWPYYKDFADKCLRALSGKNLGDRLIIESFDDRVLNYIHETCPDIELCYLIDSECGDFSDYMSLLSFTPRWIGLQYEIVNRELVRRARDAGMLVAVWDVSDEEYIEKLLEIGVDSIITDSPEAALRHVSGGDS